MCGPPSLLQRAYSPCAVRARRTPRWHRSPPQSSRRQGRCRRAERRCLSRGDPKRRAWTCGDAGHAARLIAASDSHTMAGLWLSRARAREAKSTATWSLCYQGKPVLHLLICCTIEGQQFGMNTSRRNDTDQYSKHMTHTSLSLLTRMPCVFHIWSLAHPSPCASGMDNARHNAGPYCKQDLPGSRVTARVLRFSR